MKDLEALPNWCNGLLNISRTIQILMITSRSTNINREFRSHYRDQNNSDRFTMGAVSKGFFLGHFGNSPQWTIPRTQVFCRMIKTFSGEAWGICVILKGSSISSGIFLLLIHVFLWFFQNLAFAMHIT